MLAARRRRPPQLAGGWEFPGGKVEPGESDEAALARECREELGIDVLVGPRLGSATDGRIELVLYAATSRETPQPGDDHDELRWVAEPELVSVAWLPIDAALLPQVAGSLARREPAGHRVTKR